VDWIVDFVDWIVDFVDWIVDFVDWIDFGNYCLVGLIDFVGKMRFANCVG